MNTFLQISAPRRLLAFQQVDEAVDLQAVSVEKDFWVCWTLRELFSLPRIGEHLTFQGGTSLSKAWKLIQRFSGDIDLVVDKRALGLMHAVQAEYRFAWNAETQDSQIRKLEPTFIEIGFIDDIAEILEQPTKQSC